MARYTMSNGATQGNWQFWIDRGGTFTDVVARRPDGTVVSHKLLSENPEQYDDAALEAIRQLLGVADPDAPIPAANIQSVKMGTTVATQRAPGAPGRADGAGRHQGLRRRLAHRLPEPAAAVRPPHLAARDALRTGRRSDGAHRRRWHGAQPAGLGPRPGPT